MKIKNTKTISGKISFNYSLRFTIKFLAYILITNSLFYFINANNKLKPQNKENLDGKPDLNQNDPATLNFINELTSGKIHKFFDNSDIMVILFTEPNCLKCNRFIKILSELNEKLSKENSDLKKIRLGTVNGFQEKQIVEKFNIEEIPSFLFINKRLNNEEIISDIQSTSEIYEILKRKIIRKWNILENLQQAKDFSEKRVNMIVCRNEMSEIHSEFFQKLNLIIEKYEDVNYYMLNLIKYKSDIQKLEKEFQGKFYYTHIFKLLF